MTKKPAHTIYLMGNKLPLSEVHRKFGRRVREYRLKKNLTQEQLGYELGVSLPYVSMIECGKRNVTIDKISKIAKALDIPIFQLFV